MTTRAPMRCTNCGGTMNLHAEKTIMTTMPGIAGYDPALGGYVEESHTCPACGHNDSRRAVT